MADITETSEDIKNIFQRNNWEFSGYGVPVYDDVKVVLDTCYDHLHDKPEGTVLEVGNMSVRKGNDKYHVYVHLGEFEVEEE